MRQIKYFIFSLLLLMGITIHPNAATTLSTSKSQVTKGSSFTVTVKASSVAAWNLHVSASGPVKGCSLNVADSTADAKNTTKTFSATCTSTATGTITIKLTGDTTNAAGSTSNISTSKTVKVVSKSSGGSSSSNSYSGNNSTSQNTNLSSENDLKNLTVSEGNLSPKFDADKTEYKVEVENEVESIKISATASDSNATVKGTGEKDLKEGKNSFGIVVVAENGRTKTYTVVVTRKAKDPVYVTVDDVEYLVITDFKDLEVPKNFKETTITIDDKEVKALYDDITKFTLVALQDENNNISWYICDVDTNTYTPFIEEQFTLARILILDMPSKIIPEGYKKYTQEINGNEYEVYKLNKNSDYALFYALNLDTGNKNLYMYDQEENTIQRYTSENSDRIQEKYDQLFYLTIGLCGLSAFLILLLFIVMINKGKKKHKKKEKTVIEKEVEK